MGGAHLVCRRSNPDVGDANLVSRRASLIWEVPTWFAGAAFLMWEVSTFFVHARWLLYKLGRADSRLYKANGLAMLLTFFLCRCVAAVRLVGRRTCHLYMLILYLSEAKGE